MIVQTAPHIPYHPEQCPHCKHHAATIQRCRAYATESVLSPLLGVFTGESAEACARFFSSPTSPNAPPVSEALPADNLAPLLPIQAASSSLTQAAPIPGTTPESRIHCPKCAHENQPHLQRCAVCQADLLPGEGIAVRLATFIVCLLIAGFFAWLAYAIANQTIHLPESFNDPIKAGFMAVVLPLAGLAFLFHRTPLFTRYATRADRHIRLDLRQAVADYTRALEHAPEKEQAGLLRKRAAVYEKLGQMEDATRDLLALTYAKGAYQTGASIVQIAGADPDTYTLSRAKGERSSLLEQGRAVAIGYCPACKDAVQLTSKLHCAAHPRARIKRSRLVVPSDVAGARREVLSGKKQSRPVSGLIRMRRIALLLGALILAYLAFHAYQERQRYSADIPEPTSSQAGIEEPVLSAPQPTIHSTSSSSNNLPISADKTTSEPPVLILMTAKVKGDSINVRSGPGTTYSVVGRLTSNSEIQVAGRNEAGDWLNIVDPAGWVRTDLVRLSGEFDLLAVITPTP